MASPSCHPHIRAHAVQSTHKPPRLLLSTSSTVYAGGLQCSSPSDRAWPLDITFIFLSARVTLQTSVVGRKFWTVLLIPSRKSMAIGPLHIGQELSVGRTVMQRCWLSSLRALQMVPRRDFRVLEGPVPRQSGMSDRERFRLLPPNARTWSPPHSPHIPSSLCPLTAQHTTAKLRPSSCCPSLNARPQGEPHSFP